MEYLTFIYLFSLFGSLLFTFFTLPTLYQIQIKEYRLDRIRAGWNERESFLIPFKMPARSIRNILVILIVLLLTTLYYTTISIFFSASFTLFSFLWLLGTIISKIFAIFAVIITHPFAIYSRNRKISQAKKIISRTDTSYIGITGSFGKSTVKEFLTQLLGSKFKVSSTPKNHNTDIGVAMAVIANQNNQLDYFIAEMGAYRQGEISSSCQLVTPKYGILTGLGNQHLALFGSRSNLISAKGELGRSLPEDGTLYVNIDCDRWEDALDGVQAKVKKYSIKDKSADVYGEIIDERSFNMRYASNRYKFNHRLIGQHNVLNLLGAIALSLDLGVSYYQLRDTLSEQKNVSSKLSKAFTHTGTNILLDNMNSSEDGFIAALNALSSFSKMKKYVLSRGIIELGRDEKLKAYSNILRVAEMNDISIITTEKEFHTLGYGDVKLMNEDEMLRFIKELDDDSVVLIEGRFSPRFITQLKELIANYD